MKSLLIIATILLLSIPPAAAAQDARSYDQAGTLSASQGKPILLEFFRDD